MPKNVFKIILAVTLLLVGVYLLLPSPSVPPPLPDSLKSTEPGDTVEIPGLFAYYTNLSRGEVIAFYQKHYSKSRFLGIPLITYRLNYPPEYVDWAIRDTIHTSYLEEIIHLLRESFYINGYEPVNDPFVKPSDRQAGFEIDGQNFTAKVTVAPKKSNPILRIVVFGGIILALVFLVWEVKKPSGSFRNRR